VPPKLLEKARSDVEMMKYAEPSYTGFVFPVDKYFPAWALDESHPLVQAGLEAARADWPARTPGKQVELQHQRHLLDGQGGHPSRLVLGRAKKRPRTRRRTASAGRRGQGDGVLRHSAALI
jgi:hypothetical protein